MDDTTTRWLGWAVGTLLVLAALTAFMMRYAAFSGFLRETERMVLADDVVHKAEEAFSVTDAHAAGQPGSRGFMPDPVAGSDLQWSGRAVMGVCSGMRLAAIRMTTESGQVDPAEQAAVLLEGVPLSAVSLSAIEPGRLYRYAHDVSADGVIVCTRYERMP